MTLAAYKQILRTPKDDEEFEEDNPSCSSPLQQAAASEKDALMMAESAPAAPEALAKRVSSGTFLRLTILVAVTLQNTSYALVRRYSRGYLKERYSTSSALLAMELVKLVISAWGVVFSGQASDVPPGSAANKFAHLIAHSWKMMVPGTRSAPRRNGSDADFISLPSCAHPRA